MVSGRQPSCRGLFLAGTYTDAIKLRYRDDERVAKPQIADLAMD